MTDYGGMTVNERLVISGRLEAWDAAVAAGDRAKMIEILVAASLTEKQAIFTTDTTLADPVKYGYPPKR